MVEIQSKSAQIPVKDYHVRAFAAYSFYFYCLCGIMTCLYCFILVILRFKKVQHGYDGSSERDTFALMYCRVDECNRWHRLKKTSYRLPSFFPFCHAGIRLPWRLFSYPHVLLSATWPLKDHLCVPLCRPRDTKHRDTMPTRKWNGFATKRMHVYVCARVRVTYRRCR